MKNEMRLQGIGLVEGTPAGELKVGDITRWNNGYIERITSVEFSKTGKTVVVGIEYISYSNVPQGELKQSERTFRASRLVNIIGSGNTVLRSDMRFESKPYEMVIDGKVVATLSSEEAPVEEKVVAKYERGPYKADVIHSPSEEKPYKVTIADAFGEKTFYRDSLERIHEDVMEKLAYYLVEEAPSHEEKVKADQATIQQAKVDAFKRYHELLQKALIPNNITDEEREEMIILYEEVKEDMYELAYAAFSKKPESPIKSMEYMAKYIKAGDILIKGSHKYKVTGVRREDNIIKLIYKTLKTDQFFEKTCKPDEFIKVVEQ